MRVNIAVRRGKAVVVTLIEPIAGQLTMHSVKVSRTPDESKLPTIARFFLGSEREVFHFLAWISLSVRKGEALSDVVCDIAESNKCGELYAE